MAAPRNQPLPTEEQCYALTDNQCRSILEYRDPSGIRANPDWEPRFQAELVRCYMRMLSFKQIEDQMRPRLAWTYKTYQNRFKDWLFPLDRFEREHIVREIFGWISSQEDYVPPTQWNPTPSFHDRLQIRPIQPHPPPPTSTPLQVPRDFFQPTPVKAEPYPTRPDPRLSVSTIGTFASGSTHSYSPFDDTFSSHRASIATTSSSVSSGSQYGMQYRPPRQPKHDAVAGLWNNVLRVIPCNTDHTGWRYDIPFNRCAICGFSQWHSLMVHAESVGKDSFIAAMTILRGIPKIDFAGNSPIHYLMSAGVGLEFLLSTTQWIESCPRNVSDQNPLHVLNPLGLGEQLISFLDWLKKNSPALLLQRDIYCRTPLQSLLLWPLERTLYQKVLDVYPRAEDQLRSLDNTGRNIVMRMSEASMKIKGASPSEYAKIQAGITEIKLHMSADGRTEYRNQQYGFHNIARGGRGRTYFLGHFECSICKRINAHTNSFLDQMFCAVDHGRDRYEPDDTGMTPAHALVTHLRCNMDEDRTPETTNQTFQLFRFLVPHDDPNLHEALHALDPEGNSLIYNIAIRGLDEILEYVLQLEHPSRRRALANFCARGPKGRESLLDAVHRKIQETTYELDATHKKNIVHKQILIEQGERFMKCKSLLRRAGAESRPDITTRMRIYYDSA